MLAFEALEIGIPEVGFGQDAHHVPVVGDLFRPVLVQTEGAPAKLVDAHVRGDGGQIHKDVDSACVPTLTKEPTCAHDALRDALLEEFGQHPGVVAWNPILADAPDAMVTAEDLILKLHDELFLVHPRLHPRQEARDKVVIDKNRRAGHQNRVQPVDRFGGEQLAEDRDGPSRLVVEDVLDQRRRRRALKIRDDDRSDAVAKRLHLRLEDVLEGDPLAFAVGQHSGDGCSTRARARLRDLNPVEHELLLGLLGQGVVGLALRAHQPVTDVSVDQRNHQHLLRHRHGQQGRPGFGHLWRHAAPLPEEVEPTVVGQGAIASLKRVP